MRKILFFVVILLGGGGLAHAYDPQAVTTSGTVVTWPNKAVTLSIESDLDVAGKSVSTLLDNAVSMWTSITEASISMTKGSLGAAVDNDNVCCHVYDGSACNDSSLLTNGVNPIVVDEDGTITARFFGSGNQFSTLGFAAIVSYSQTTGEAVKGEAVFNAACLNTVEKSGCNGLSFSDDDFTSFMVHELGHFLGLNHSQVNRTESKSGASFDGTLVTTMWPFFVQGNGANFKTPERDDKVGLAFLYPSSTFASTTGKVSGTVSASGSQFQCANVIARNMASGQSKIDAISFVSGSLHAGAATDGTYEIQGLTAGQNYSIQVEPIDKTLTGASGIPPCDASGSNPSPSNKQFTGQTSSTTVSASAGSSATAVDFSVTTTSSDLNTDGSPMPLEAALTETPQEVTDPEILDDIAELELRTKDDSASCKSTTTGTVSTNSSSKTGCALMASADRSPRGVDFLIISFSLLVLAGWRFGRA